MTEDRNDQSSSFRGAADHFREKPIPQWARDPLQQVSSRLQRHWISSLLLFFLPSFVSSYFRPNSSTARTKPLHETAYLDGLRGVAAFVVYLHHTQLMYRRDSLYGYGSIPDSRHFLQLPFFRIIVGGQAAVTLFFVISVRNWDALLPEGHIRRLTLPSPGIRAQHQDAEPNIREPV